MNVYIWQSIDHASNNYHEGGGVVVFADSLQDAIALAAKEGALIKKNEKPDAVYPVAMNDLDQMKSLFGTPIEPSVWVMPDAGCC